VADCPQIFKKYFINLITKNEKEVLKLGNQINNQQKQIQTLKQRLDAKKKASGNDANLIRAL